MPSTRVLGERFWVSALCFKEKFHGKVKPSPPMERLTLVNISKGFERGIIPLGLISIAGYLKKYGGYQDISLLDSNCQDIYAGFKPTDIVGISSVTQDIKRAVHFAEFVKSKYDVPVILGGVHISTYGKLPEVFDLGVMGEGENTVLELMQLERFSIEKAKRINGVCFNENGKTHFTPPRELITPLDKIPISDRDIADMEFYLKKRQIIPYHFGRSLTMMTSRGCPYSCAFCSTKVHWKTFRAFSAERVIEEIELLINKYHAEIIHIFDDLFIADKKRLAEIHRMVMKKGFNKKAKFMCLVRSDMLDEPTIKLLKEINVVITGIGMESGCEKTLDYLKKRTTTLQDNRNAIKLSEKYRLPAMGSFMIGNPHETEEELLQTAEFIKSYRYSPYLCPLTYIATPFPGTQFWDYAKEKGLNVEDFDNLVMDIPLEIESLKNAPLLTDIPLERFFEITKLFVKEALYGEVKRNIYMPKDILSPLRAIKIAMLAEKNIFTGIRELIKMMMGIQIGNRG